MISLRPYQHECVDSIFKEFQDHNSTLAVLATGLGKCFARGTPILMSNGVIIPVECVQVGDELMGWDSSPRKVVSRCHGRDEMFIVKPVKGEPYIVNQEHILSLKITGKGKGVHCLGKFRKSGEIVNISVGEYMRESKTFKHMAKGWRMPVSDFYNSFKD